MGAAADSRSRRPRDRKATILAAAAELFAERGFAAVSVDEIGQRVGISGPAIYRHFTGKEALLDAIALDTVAGWVGRIEDAVKANPDAPMDRALLARAVSETVGFSFDRPSHLAAYSRERRRLSPDVHRRVLRLERRLHELWLRTLAALRPDLDPQRVAAREAAAVGALSALGARPPLVARPRLDDLVSESIVAVLLAPRADAPAEGDESAGWMPAPSRRDEILGAALALFRTRGYHGVGIDEIGSAAGMIGQSVYHHYESKGSLLVDAFDRATAAVATAMDAALSRAESPCDALMRLARAYVAVAYDSVDLIAVTSREDAALPEGDRERIARRQRDLRDVWVSVLREIRVDLTQAEALTVTSGVFPLVNQVALLDDQRPPEDEVVTLVRAFCLGEPTPERLCNDGAASTPRPSSRGDRR